MRQNALLRAQESAVELLHDALIAHRPPGRRFRADIPAHLLRLGGYLLTLGYATPRQIALALSAQRRSTAGGELVPLGDILVAQAVIAPQPLAAVLLVQLVDRALVREVPKLLGECLLADEVVTPDELARAIEEQIRCRRQGERVPLGELLVRQGSLERIELNLALLRQRSLTAGLPR